MESKSSSNLRSVWRRRLRNAAPSASYSNQGETMLAIPVGAKGAFSLTVTPEHLASRFKDATLPPVLATPVMIMAMENAALNAIKPYLKERGECGGNPHRRASFGGNACRQASRRGSAGNQGRWSPH